jgi:formylglycine-generating enzyme required for sulfatase activity
MPPPAGMVWIDGGEFSMGTDDQDVTPQEQPANYVYVDGFWMDVDEVSVEEFARFVAATSYTSVAERAGGALVFAPPNQAVSTADEAAWWAWVTGANWRWPRGPAGAAAAENEPVVQVAYEDALAYAHWTGKRLPTEAEWECAARGGLKNARYPWGMEQIFGDVYMANLWQGAFPHAGVAADGFVLTAPVSSYATNAFGLHDMIGNVWEWCADPYDPDVYWRRCAQGVSTNPCGPDPRNLPAGTVFDQRAVRGGSFLSTTERGDDRVTSRLGLATDTCRSDLGFRCVRTAN